MYKIANRILEDETFHDLPGRYATPEEAQEAAKHLRVQVRRNGEFIRPEEFEILETDD